MKSLVLVLLVGLLVSCAKDKDNGPCGDSPLNGVWKSGYNTLEFRPNCTGFSSYCTSEFTYANASTAEGMVTINSVTNRYNYQCVASGKTVCSYEVVANYMTLTCGMGTEFFTRRR